MEPRLGQVPYFQTDPRSTSMYASYFSVYVRTAPSVTYRTLHPLTFRLTLTEAYNISLLNNIQTYLVPPQYTSQLTSSFTKEPLLHLNGLLQFYYYCVIIMVLSMCVTLLISKQYQVSRTVYQTPHSNFLIPLFFLFAFHPQLCVLLVKLDFYYQMLDDYESFRCYLSGR